MASLSYSSLKSARNLRDHDEKQRNERNLTILVLILDFLKENAFLQTADALLRESKSSQQDISAMKVCDNMDLGTILLEYQCNYLSRLQKKPKLVRQIFPEEKEKKSATVAVGKKPQPRWPTSAVEGKEKKPKPLLSAADLPNVTGTKLEPFAPNHDENLKSVQLSTPNCVARLNAAMAVYEGQHGNELLDLAVTISREMFLEDPNVHWDDIKGMEDAKRLIKEAIVYPVRYPELFKGILAPWRGLLLTGPPGTGKTMLAKAVATECKTAFFNITASTVVSKWRGESEKLVRVLFEMARKCAPSCIFLDELDSLMGQRGEKNEHEGSRRMKTEILMQMDGLQRSTDLVFVLAASNLPWDLDFAMLRRLEKRVFVHLPNAQARRAMFCRFLPSVFDDHPLGIRTELDYNHLAELTTGFSGSDIQVLCKETAMRAVRGVLALLDQDTSTGPLLTQNVKIEPIVTADVLDVLRYTKPLQTQKSLAKYEEWTKLFEAS